MDRKRMPRQLSFSPLTPSSGTPGRSSRSPSSHEYKDAYGSPCELTDKIRRSVSKKRYEIPRTPDTIRRSFDSTFVERKRSIRDPRRTTTFRKNESTAWQLLKFDLLEKPVIHLLIEKFVPRVIKRWLSWRNNCKTTFTVEISGGRRNWKPLAIDVAGGDVLTFACQAGKLETMVVRVTVRKGGVDIGCATLRVLELLDPALSGGKGGGGGVHMAAVREGGDVDGVERAVGRVGLRGVVGSRDGVREGGMRVLVACAMSVRKEMKGVVMRVVRRGGGRQPLLLGERAVEGDAFGEVDVGGGLLWFGVGGKGRRSVRIRLEWVRKIWGKWHVLGGVDMAWGDWGRGEAWKVLWQNVPNGVPVGTRLLVADRIRRGGEGVEIEFRLTR